MRGEDISGAWLLEELNVKDFVLGMDLLSDTMKAEIEI